MAVDNQRIVLLNRLVSRSPTRAPREHQAPTHGASELLQILEKRRAKKLTVEFFGSEDDDDERKRMAKGAGHSLIRLRQLRFETRGKVPYAVLLIEYVDESQRTFPVVHTQTFDGREIAGEEEERGAVTAHMVVRLPEAKAYDDGAYRCAIEAVHGITRRDVETFIDRQLRREDDWTFSVTVPKKKSKGNETRAYLYHPKLEFFADVGRALQTLTEGRILSQMVFTKRSQRQQIGQPTDVLHEDVLADVEYRISGRQAPEDPGERQTWATTIRRWYEERGYETRLYYRHIKGSVVSGDVHQSVASATDLLMCTREIISLATSPKRWRSRIDSETVEKMIELLDKDALWEQTG